MRIGGSARVLDDREVGLIHDAMLRILSDVGMRIESEAILARLAEAGGDVDRAAMTVRFAPEAVEEFLAESDEFDWSTVQPQVTASAHVSIGRYLDPETGEHAPWTEQRVAAYAKVADRLDRVSGANMLGCPLPGAPHAIHPLHQRYVCWKYGMRPGGSIWDIRLCPFLLEMCEVMADARGGTVADFWTGGVYLTTTLKLAADEAAHYLYFTERGLPVAIGHMTSAGGSAPVTLAGAVALHLAESVVINMIQRAYRGGRAFQLSCTIAPLDMRSLTYPYGSPERQIANLMTADMAKHYRVPFTGHSGHTDAKTPGSEAGLQRALTSIPTLMGCARTHVAAGLLGTDMVCSPIQMIIDNEYVGALERLARGCEITDETLAVDVIGQVGPGNLFIETEHTAAHFRDEFWTPGLWSREMLDAWLSDGARTDVDRALDRFREIMAEPDDPPVLDARTEQRLREIMARATRELA